MTLPHARYTPLGDVELRFPYDAALVEAIKTRIPATYRTYAPATKTWTVLAVGGWPTVAVGLLRDRFPRAEVVAGSGPPEPAPIRRHDADYAVLHLLPSAPAGLIEAVYRHLARERHPDRGGTHEGMLGLNAAVERLRERGVA